MKTVLVSYDIAGVNAVAGGVATFICHFANLLRAAGDDVLLLHAAHAGAPAIDPIWKVTYESRGIEFMQINEAQQSPRRWPMVWTLNLSEKVAEHIRYADVVYFQDWCNHGFHTLRTRRFQADRGPTCVTVLHGSSKWVDVGLQTESWVFDNLIIEYAERYAARYSDFIAAPSRFMLGWLLERGWQLPPSARVQILGLPYTAPLQSLTTALQPASRFKRIVFYGRLEKIKGCELFIDALIQLQREASGCLNEIDQVVFLGADSALPGKTSSRFGNGAAAAAALREVGLSVEIINSLDSQGAQRYLTDHATDTLVVIPSLRDNFPYTAIEASLIPGLNLLCSRAGGLPEVLGAAGVAQLFDPTPSAFASKLREWLDHGPLSADHLSQYDVEAANQRWLNFHDMVCAQSRRQNTERSTHPLVKIKPSTHAAVDVCVAYFNHSQYLPQLLLSLEHQSVQDFQVIVIDDGSTEPEAQTVFRQMQAQYATRGWHFLHQANAYPGAARNAAVRQGESEYICFIDADDVAAPNMVERFLEAIRLSGDDCLVAPCYYFEGEAFPYDLHTGQTTIAAQYIYMPVGSAPVHGIFDNILGGNVMIIRRTVFEAMGGYAEERGLGYEDYELHTRLTLAGYKMDVLPEVLQFYRVVKSGITHTTDDYPNYARVMRLYNQQLKQVGLGGFASALHGLYEKSLTLNKPRQLPTPALQQPQLPPTPTPERHNGQLRKLKVLMVLPNCPYPPDSGFHIRLWEEVKYFGTVHNLTLVTFIETPTLPVATHEVLARYCRDLHIVPHLYSQTEQDFQLPHMVADYTTAHLAEALQAVQPSTFDFALIDTIFMADYRNLLNTFCVLTEHNIESSLLRQLASQNQANIVYQPPPILSRPYDAEASVMESYENTVWPTFPLRVTVSAKDKVEMDHRCQVGQTIVIENGTNINPEMIVPDTVFSRSPKAILYMGTMDYYPNADAVLYFVSEIWPLIHAKDPNLRFYIAGRNPSLQIQDLAFDPNIKVFASPRNMVAVAKDCCVSIVPLRIGGGTRIKILDSMAMGLPVVSTSLGCEALPVQNGEHLLIGETPASFAEAVVTLTAVQELWSRLRSNGLDLVHANCGWPMLFERMDKQIREVLKARSTL